MTLLQPDLFAPHTFACGAPVAQTCAPHHPETLKGNGAGAKVRHTPAPSGAAVAHRYPNRVSDKLVQARQAVREAASLRAELQPHADAHSSAIRAARERLQAHHDKFGMLCHPDEIKRRLAIHDDILAASIRWGKQAREYRELNTIINQLTRQIEQLTEGKAA
jgi:hypothetical protein